MLVFSLFQYKRVEKQIASMRLIQNAVNAENKQLKSEREALLKEMKANSGAMLSFDGGYVSSPDVSYCYSSNV